MTDHISSSCCNQREPASYSFVFHFPTFNCLCNHCHLSSLFLLFSCLLNELTIIICSAFFLYSIFSLLFFPYLFVSVYLFVLLASAQAPLPLHLRTRLCLPPLIGQSVPTLARSVCHPRRQMMQVHSLSITLSHNIAVE